ncbi:restriction endonuclease [Haloparvum sedimenti]|uniref:restriction endonuclease n=1 Tax=Haloparvum sedimenti TaxID=1678448 RepID=UPI00071E9BAC|nr:restriction endonuclease [Haloparvum sedimenti]
MDWRTFEHVVGDLWEEMGYTTVVRQGSNDRKIDVIARKRGPGGKTIAIQVKRYDPRAGNDVTRTEVQEYYGIHTQIDADECMIVTSGEFAADAEEIAERLGVRTVDGEEFLLAMERHASLDFYAKHAAALGIETGDVWAEVAARSERSTAGRVRTYCRSMLGRAEVLAGRASREVGNANVRWRGVSRRARLRLRGYDPAIYAERNGNGRDGPADTDGSGDTSAAAQSDRSSTADRLREVGRRFRYRGTDRMRAPPVTWSPGGRSLTPSTGVRPRLRRSQWFSRSRQTAACLIAAVCCLLVSAATLAGVDIVVGGYPVEAFLVGGAAVGVVGIVAPSLVLARTPVEAARAAYAPLAAVPVVAWVIGGYSSVASSIHALTALVVAATAGFLIHTRITSARATDDPSFSLGGAELEYQAIHNPITLAGLAGCVLVWSALALAALDAAGLVGLGSGPQRTLAAVGLLIVVAACLGYVWNGGVVGITASVVAFGGVVTLASMRAAVPLATGVDAGVLFGGVLSLLVAATFLLFHTEHRTVARWQVLVGGLSAGFLLEVTDYWPVRVVARSSETVGGRALIAATAVAATALFCAVLWLERRAIRETLGR